MSVVKVAFIGAGGNASGHMKRVKELCEGAEIVAICDVDGERAKAATDEFGGTPYTDHHDMLDKEGMDALYVSVPPFAHSDAEVIAAGKGIHLFVEKPVALTMEKGLEVNEAIEKAGIISCVGYQVRYAESVNRAKAWLEGKTVTMVNCHRWGGVPGTAWWCVMSKSGGQIVEQTTHQVDLIRYLCGEFVEIEANYALRHSYENEGFDIPDAMATTFKLAGGAVGVLTSSCAMINGGGKGELEIMADHCVLKWATSSVSAVPGEHPELAGELGPLPPIDPVFIEAVRTGDASKIRSPYLDGLKSLDVTLAMNKSGETGRPEKPHFAG